MNGFIQQLLRGNGAFSKDRELTVQRHQLSEEGQKPKAIIITCSDSRVIPEQIFAQDVGTFLTIENAGARVTNEVLRDVKFFVNEFESVFMVILMGHSQCGYYSHAVTHGVDIDPIILESFRKSFKTEQEIIDHVAKMAVVEGASKISEVVPNHIEVRGAFYNIKSGTVDF